MCQRSLEQVAAYSISSPEFHNYRTLKKIELLLSGNENTIDEIMSYRNVTIIQFPYILGV